MDIAIASGKGGTGKTTVALSLARHLAGRGTPVSLLDCDVEEPNVNLFLGAVVSDSTPATVPVPAVDDGACTGCGACERLCAFSAIVLIKGRPLVLPDMCHSCGGCAMACPARAIHEVPRAIGVVESGEAAGIGYAGGRLAIGEPVSPPLIRAVKNRHRETALRIIDCPPGTSCPVIEATRNADFLVLVTEPTAFGLHDLALAVEMAREIEIPFGVVVNRCDSGDERVTEFCRRHNVPVLASFPSARELAEEYSRGDCTSYLMHHYGEELGKIMQYIVCGAAFDDGAARPKRRKAGVGQQ